ncbi:MAG TPA: cytochrome c oxidase subunit 3 [Nevskiaceae bacterium]
MSQPELYYVPHRSSWPIVAAIALLVMVVGAGNWLIGNVPFGPVVLVVGALILATMFFGWFGRVIHESMSGVFNQQADTSFRIGMVWFIVSEVFFFLAFFGGLFYIRMFVVPWMGGAGEKGLLTHAFIWHGYASTWPTNGPLAIGGAFSATSPWGIPLINTILLLASSFTLTIGHHRLLANHRKQLLAWLGVTVLLGIAFLYGQAHEYWDNYAHFNMTLHSGIYGATFYILTGFHCLHVTIGTIMLIVIWLRCARGHFDREHAFGFEAVSWYWHFVDVVWLNLFLFVYIL